MEHPTHQDTPPPGGQNAHPPPPQLPLGLQPLPQLPPQMFTTAAQLLDLTDSEMFPPGFHFEIGQEGRVVQTSQVAPIGDLWELIKETIG